MRILKRVSENLPLKHHRATSILASFLKNDSFAFQRKARNHAENVKRSDHFFSIKSRKTRKFCINENVALKPAIKLMHMLHELCCNY